MRFSWLLGYGLLPLALGGCSSGQTGSPDCAGSESCLCDPLYSGGIQLRVHAESFESGQLVAVVDEVVTSMYYPNDLKAGDRIGGALIVEKPCARDEVSASLVGAELFVRYHPGRNGSYPNCTAFQDCSVDNCMGLAEPELSNCWDACAISSEELCNQEQAAALMAGVFSWAVVWGEQLDFGGDKQLASSELDVLSDPSTCRERFPPPPPPPCDDTRSIGQCAVARPGPTSSAARPFGTAFGLLALAYALRRFLGTLRGAVD